MNRSRAASVLVGISIVVAALAAATIAHVLLDALGDIVLAHDTYDDIAHGSRPIVVVIGAAGFALLLFRLWFEAFAEARGRHGAMRAILADAARRARSIAAGVTTVGLAMLAVACMESFDIVLAGGSDFELRAILGGSVGLGLGITLAIGALFAHVLPRTLDAFARSFDRFVAVVREACIGLSPATGTLARLGRALRPVRIANRSILARRAGKRAPPQSPRIA